MSKRGGRYTTRVDPKVNNYTMTFSVNPTLIYNLPVILTSVYHLGVLSLSRR